MIAITKSVLALGALVAVGTPVAFSNFNAAAPAMTGRSAQMVIDTAFAPFSADANRVAVKGDRLPLGPCASQNWPYLSADCVASADGAPPPRPVRMIVVERRVGEAGSALILTPAQQYLGY